MADSQRPSIGRIVHYVSYGTPRGEFTSQCRAAVVTETSEDASHIGLCAINSTGQFFHSLNEGGCWFDGSDTPKGGTWHWPERAE
jgi:hypothetical protein